MDRGRFLSAFAIDPAAYIEQVEGKYRFFYDGKSIPVRRDTAKWALKRLDKYVRSYWSGATRRFVCVFPELRESLFTTFAIRDNVESLARKALVEAVAEDAHGTVESGVRERMLALPEPIVLELMNEARDRVQKL